LGFDDDIDRNVHVLDCNMLAIGEKLVRANLG